MRRLLTKSDFLLAWQCKKKAYYGEHYQRLGIVADPLTDIQQEILSAGTMVGRIGREYFPNGKDCEGNEEKTTEYIHEERKESTPMTLYEATFVSKSHGVKVSCDILSQQAPPSIAPPTGTATTLPWHLYEIKSSTSVKDVHILDASIQYWTLRWLGLPIQTVNILYLNSDYTRHGPLDYRQLFCNWDCTNEAIEYEQELTSKLQEFHECLDQPLPPDITIGHHCKKPYPCPYLKTCYSQHGLPSYSILDLTNARLQHWKLFDCGIKSFQDVPKSAMKSLSFQQVLQVLVEKHQKPYYNLPHLKKFLSKIKYPISFLDFETFSSPIPCYDSTKPYQAICFQYSLHILSAYSSCKDLTALDINPLDSTSPCPTLDHFSFLADGTPDDPRHTFLSSLLSHLSSNSKGTILVYNLSYESIRLKELAKLFPQYKDRIADIINRMVDLALPFQSRDIVTKEMRGKYSIKAVLPALVPSMSERYQELEISNGYQANVAYLSLMKMDLPPEEREKIRDNLLRYCELDTLAMVMILEELQKICNRKYSPDDLLDLDSEIAPV